MDATQNDLEPHTKFVRQILALEMRFSIRGLSEDGRVNHFSKKFGLVMHSINTLSTSVFHIQQGSNGLLRDDEFVTQNIEHDEVVISINISSEFLD